MHPSKISYSQSHESYSSSTGLKSWIKMGVEVELSPGDSVPDAINYAKEIVKGEMMYNQPVEILPSYVTLTEVVSELQKNEGIAEAINSCTTLKVLERFRPMVERQKDETLSDIYNNKKKELQ